jgi:multidrug efflux pump
MMVLSIYSPDDRYSSTYIDNYTNLYVLDELKRVPGANRASVFGLPDIAMRVWLQPDRMAQLGITVGDVSRRAVRARTSTFGQSARSAGQPSVARHSAADVSSSRAAGAPHQPEQFEDIIVPRPAGRAWRAVAACVDIGRGSSSTSATTRS